MIINIKKLWLQPKSRQNLTLVYLWQKIEIALRSEISYLNGIMARINILSWESFDNDLSNLHDTPTFIKWYLVSFTSSHLPNPRLIYINRKSI